MWAQRFGFRLLVSLCFCLGCTPSLEHWRNYADLHCLRWSWLMQTKADSSLCQQETLLERAKRLRAQGGDLTEAIDQLLAYLETHPQSEEARQLLGEFASAKLESLAWQIDQALSEPSSYHVWKIAKDVEYLAHRLKPWEVIPPGVIQALLNHPEVRIAVEQTEKNLMAESQAGDAQTLGSKQIYDPAIAAVSLGYFVGTALACMTTHDKGFCRNASSFMPPTQKP